MYELVRVSETAYYMDCPAKAGFYVPDGKSAYLIDSGSDKDAAKKIKKILDGQGWTLKTIFNTHSHADHTGGNQYLAAQTGCGIYAPGADCAVARYPVLEPAMLYGGFPLPELMNKFLMAKPSDSAELAPEVLPDGLEAVPLPGHCYEMTGFRTADGVLFLADCLASEETLSKYGIGYVYDVKAYLETLDRVKEMRAECFVPAHAPAVKDIAPLAQLNAEKTLETADRIADLLKTPLTQEELLKKVFDAYGLKMNAGQWALIGSTVRSYLTYLKNEGRADYTFEDNRMLWRSVPAISGGEEK